jgi:hypothetical protein
MEDTIIKNPSRLGIDAAGVSLSCNRLAMMLPRIESFGRAARITMASSGIAQLNKVRWTVRGRFGFRLGRMELRRPGSENRGRNRTKKSSKLAWKMAADARRLVKSIQRMEKQSAVLLANPDL